jgi:hypothetical protein
MFNCSFKLLALVLLCSVLQFKLRISAVRQLAFVLEGQWFSVQTKAVFGSTTTCSALCSTKVRLDIDSNKANCVLRRWFRHAAGYDYSFQFAWLQGDAAPTSGGSNSTAV